MHYLQYVATIVDNGIELDEQKTVLLNGMTGLLLVVVGGILRMTRIVGIPQKTRQMLSYAAKPPCQEY